jgi:hypothetical protein
MVASAKVTTNVPAIADTRVMMFLLLRSSAPNKDGTRPLLAVRAPNHLTQARRTPNLRD